MAREAAAAYLRALPATVSEGVGALTDAIDVLAGSDLSNEPDTGLLDRVAELDRQAARLDAQRTRLLAEIERRQAFREVGAVTLTSWYRDRTRAHPGRASARASAAKRLRHFDQLASAYERGDVTEAHVDVVTRAAVPRRIPALVDNEATLVRLATQASPKDLARAVALIRDTVDPDGSEDAIPGHDDPARYLHASPVEHGMVKIDGLIDQLPGELLLTLVHAMSAPQPASDGERDPRTPGQRRADALTDILERAASTDDLPSVNGYPLHVLLSMDLLALTGPDDPTRRWPRLRYTGDLHPEVARRLAQAATRVQPLLTMGPWRAAGVGRTQRALPAWLRAPLEVIHQQCRGPACDTPVPWGDVHHLQAWAEDGRTDLDNSLPLCDPHHDLLDQGWCVALDLDTGEVIWTSPDGREIRVRPPP